ncbi:unnamed protein product [Fusarium graminearum]|nr:unnamed protein product [Fusarium graminearum]
MVGTATCYTQGLFVSLGDLASSMFITAIAVHTYLAVVKGRQTPQRVLYGVIIGIWIFVYTISLIPIAITSNGAEYGGFFVLLDEQKVRKFTTIYPLPLHLHWSSYHVNPLHHHLPPHSPPSSLAIIG